MAGPETNPATQEGKINPYLIDFLRLKDDEYISIDKIKFSRPNQELSFGLEITKNQPDSPNSSYMIVDQTLLDSARDWMLSQPPAEELTEAEIKDLYGIAGNLLKMYIKLEKKSTW